MSDVFDPKPSTSQDVPTSSQASDIDVSQEAEVSAQDSVTDGAESSSLSVEETIPESSSTEGETPVTTTPSASEEPGTAAGTLPEVEVPAESTETEALQEPTKKVSFLFQIVYFLTTFSSNIILLPVGILLIPLQAELFSGSAAAATTNQGLAQALGGVASVIAAPIVGALSDRTTARFGRRRTWLLIGTLLAAGALVWLANSAALWMVFVGWFVLQFMADAMRGMLQAVIPDRVPSRQRGLLSNYVGLALSLGSVVGTLMIAVVFKSNQLMTYYLFLVSLIIIPVFLFMYKETPLPKDQVEPFRLGEFLGRFWVSPIKYPSFAWAFASRLSFFMAYFMVVLFLRNYLVNMGNADPARAVNSVQSILLVPMIVSSILAGIISDRLQRRKSLVLIAGLIATAAFLAPAILNSWTGLIIWAVLLGIGYGMFFAIDTALSIQVLPQAQNRGRDLGIIALAMAIPQIIAPLTSAWTLNITGNNFAVLFGSAAVFALLAALLVIPIKGVR